MSDQVSIMFTMDCEPAHSDVTPYARQMSGSGPSDYEESASSIQAFVNSVQARGYPVTLFLHPKVAVQHTQLCLDLQAQGACLGLHLHPYKFHDGSYRYDLGAYTRREQQEMLEQAVEAWEAALGERPLYFRGGYFSANDHTFSALLALGFRGGSLSCPGRVLPQHFSVWAGAEHYPHRAHLAFRQRKGSSTFVEVPVSVDLERPVKMGAAGEHGYEWPYIPAPQYDHAQVTRNILNRFQRDDAPYGTLVMDTHNDQDYADPHHPASRNLKLILDTIDATCTELEQKPTGTTLADLCDLV